MQSKEFAPILARLGGRTFVAIILGLAIVVLAAAVKVSGWEMLMWKDAEQIQDLSLHQQVLNKDLGLMNAAEQAATRGVDSAHSTVQQTQADFDNAERAYESISFFVRTWMSVFDRAELQQFDDKQAGRKKEAEQMRAALDAAKKGLTKAKDILATKGAARAAIEQELSDVNAKLGGLPMWKRIQVQAYSNLWRWKFQLLIFVICFVTPIPTWLRKTFVWFGPGALVEWRPAPLRFPHPTRNDKSVSVSGNQTSVHVSVPHNHVGWFRDECVDRSINPRGSHLGSPRMLSKRYWLMSLIDGLWWLAQYDGDPDNHTAVTISHPDDAAVEFAEIEIPSGESLIIRPHYLVGVVFPNGRRPQFRKHWRLGHLHAWVVGQIWFFEISGPVRLVVRGSRGIRPHRVVDDDSLEDRINPGSLVAFCARLKLRVCRGPNFWQYLGGSAPVFKYSFSGGSTYITQETQAGSRRGGPLAWFAAIGDGLFKLFGF